jgi:hypothetical protein
MKCPNPPAYRYTWPGQDEAHLCEHHAETLQNIAHAMGFPVQLIPLSLAEVTNSAGCHQNVKETTP